MTIHTELNAALGLLVDAPGDREQVCTYDQPHNRYC
jgi:hypothetical protein